MPGGKGNINGSDGNTFSSENQPTKRRGASFKNKLKEALENNPERLHKIIDEQIKKAEKGDSKAFQLLSELIDGKPTQKVENEITIPKPTPKTFIDFGENVD